jgi:transposase
MLRLVSRLMKGVIMPRHRLTDEQWELIADLFPKPKRTGRPPRQRRDIVDAVLWILRTGSPWRDLPEHFGPWATAWDLFDKWNADGTLCAMLDRLRGHVTIDEQLWCVDGTIVRAARCAAGGGKKGMPTNRRITPLAAVAAV